MSLQESLKKTVSFRYKNTNTQDSKRLGIFPGHYDTSELSKDGSGNVYITHGNPTPLVEAGYQCDQIADDFNSKVTATSRANAKDPIEVRPVKGRTRVADFLNYVKYSGSKVTKIRITDYSGDTTRALFNGELEISQSSIGSKGGSDYLQLSTYIDARNFQTNIIEIDLEQQNLLLDETTVVIMDVPAGADFQMDYILA